MVTDDIAAGRLVQLLPEYESLEQPIYAIFPHRTYIPAKVVSTIDRGHLRPLSAQRFGIRTKTARSGAPDAYPRCPAA